MVVSKNAQDTIDRSHIKIASVAEDRCQEGDYDEHKTEAAEIPGLHHEGTTDGEPLPYG